MASTYPGNIAYSEIKCLSNPSACFFTYAVSTTCGDCEGRKSLGFLEPADKRQGRASFPKPRLHALEAGPWLTRTEQSRC